MSEAYAQVRTGKLKFKAKKKRKSGRGQESTHEQVDDTYLPEEPKEREGLEKPSGPLGSSKSKKSKQKKKRKSKRERETDKKLDHFERRKREKKIERGEDPDADEEVASDDSEAELNELLKNLTPAQRNFLKQKRKQEEKEVKNQVAKSHREKIDELNEHLAKMPVQNDIPKVAAAGVG